MVSPTHGAELTCVEQLARRARMIGTEPFAF